MKHIIKQVGFSLVELSVVLAVIGLTISGALVIATKKTISDKIEETNYKMDRIERAMDAYLTQNGRLPCVAEGGAAKTHEDFGWEDGVPTVNGANGECVKDVSASNFESGSVHYGGVPTKDLKIPDEFMFDGWGRRFSYAVDARFANSEATNALCDGVNDGGAETEFNVCFKYADGDPATPIITVEDAAGQNRTTTAVYVLISHGQNGFGAWPNFGGAELTAPTDADELENAGNDEGAFDTTFVQKDETTTFDDIVRYRTKWQIMEDSMLLTDFDLCSSALDVVDDIGSGVNALVDACDGLVGDLQASPNHSDCEKMAEQIVLWCLDM